MENKPITFIDPNGDDIIGTSEKSAERTKNIILNDVFQKPSFNDFKSLISLDSDNKTFKKIDQKKFDESTKNLTPDEKALALGYFKAINDDKKHFVTVYLKTDKIGSSNANIFKADGISENDKGSIIDEKFGGGANIRINNNVDRTIICMNSEAQIHDAFSTRSGQKALNHKSTAGELITHELIGHGLTLYNGYSEYNTWKNAILMTNLYLRVNKVEIFRNGTYHQSPKKPLVSTSPNVNYRLDALESKELPNYLK
jgi:hypothetical protein